MLKYMHAHDCSIAGHALIPTRPRALQPCMRQALPAHLGLQLLHLRPQLCQPGLCRGQLLLQRRLAPLARRQRLLCLPQLALRAAGPGRGGRGGGGVFKSFKEDQALLLQETPHLFLPCSWHKRWGQHRLLAASSGETVGEEQLHCVTGSAHLEVADALLRRLQVALRALRRALRRLPRGHRRLQLALQLLAQGLLLQ